MNRSWFSIKNISDDMAEVFIYDEIGLFGVTARDFAEELKAIGDRKIKLRINSPGGDVFQGAAIFNLMRDHKPGVEVSIDGYAASMASVIAMAGAPVRMASNAMMIIHNPSGLVHGTAKEMEQTAKNLEKVKASIINAYASKTGKDSAEISAWMDGERWMTAEEAKADGFVDEITAEVKMAAVFHGEVKNSFKKPLAGAEAAAEITDGELAALEAQLRESAQRFTDLEKEAIGLRAEVKELRAAKYDLDAKLQASEAEAKGAKAECSRYKDLFDKLKASKGLAPASVVPVIEPPKDGGDKTDDAKLYDEWEAKPHHEGAKMLEDPAIKARIYAESARRAAANRKP